MSSPGSRARQVLVAGARASWRVIARMSQTELTVAGGGIAMFALLATVPAVAAVVSIYALVADPQDIPSHLGPLRLVLPSAVFRFLVDELGRAARNSSEVSLTLVSSLVISIYSARGALGALFEGLGRAFHQPVRRSRWEQLILSVVAATGAMLALLACVLVVVAGPQLAMLLRLGDDLGGLQLLRWPALLVIVTIALVLLYRVVAGPIRVWPGAVAATAAWLAASYALELWVDQIADYEVLYGAFAGVIVLILWFYVSAMCVLMGAVINAELGTHAVRPVDERKS